MLIVTEGCASRKPAGHAALHVKLTSSVVWDKKNGGSEVRGEKMGFFMKQTENRKIRIKSLEETTQGMAQT